MLGSTDSVPYAGLTRAAGRRPLSAGRQRRSTACEIDGYQRNLGHTMGFLKDKRALIIGIASDRSIANGIAKAMHREGAELALTYQNDTAAFTIASAAAGS